MPLDAAVERDTDPQTLRCTGPDPASRVHYPIARDAALRARAAATGSDARPSPPYAERASAQRARLDVRLLPASATGPFPQTAALRGGRIGADRCEERGSGSGRSPGGDRPPGEGRTTPASAQRSGALPS
ncbi:hypothetical protein [Streptomyces sp. NPDC001851]|uniref:hypothetical protein n=1 Tax=Streptomyces sp. NPDC001851 TaxID=3154529 RepID=UPI0033220A21